MGARFLVSSYQLSSLVGWGGRGKKWEASIGVVESKQIGRSTSSCLTRSVIRNKQNFFPWIKLHFHLAKQTLEFWGEYFSFYFHSIFQKPSFSFTDHFRSFTGQGIFCKFLPRLGRCNSNKGLLRSVLSRERKISWHLASECSLMHKQGPGTLYFEPKRKS